MRLTSFITALCLTTLPSDAIVAQATSLSGQLADSSALSVLRQSKFAVPGLDITVERPAFAPLKIGRVEIGSRGPSGTLESTILHGVTLETEGLKLSADKIVVSGDLMATAYVDVILLGWFKSIGLLDIQSLPEVSQQFVAGGLAIENLKIETKEVNKECLVSAEKLVVDGVKTEQVSVPLATEEHLVFSGLMVQNLTQTVRANMFYNTPLEQTSALRIRNLIAEGIAPEAFVKQDTSNPLQAFLSLRAHNISIADINWLETPLRRTRTAIPQRFETRIASATVSKLDRGKIEQAEIKGFSTEQSTFGRTSAMAFETLALREWTTRSYAHLLSLLATSNHNVELPNEITRQATFANLWPGGPLDIGLGQIFVSRLSGNFDRYRFGADQIGMVTQRDAEGRVRSLEFQPATLKIIAAVPRAEAPATFFQLMGLASVNLSWQFKARFDPRADITQVERFVLNADQFGTIQGGLTLGGFEAARKKQNALAFLNRWIGIMPMGSPDRGGRNSAQADVSAMGAVRLKSFNLGLEDNGGLDRIVRLRLTRNNQSFRPTNADVADERGRLHDSLRERIESTVRDGRDTGPFSTPKLTDGLLGFLKRGGKLDVVFADREGLALRSVTSRNPAFTTKLKVTSRSQQGR